MKKIYNSLIVVFLFASLVSCTKDLTKPPIGLLTMNEINSNPTKAELESSVKSSYQLLSSTLNVVGHWDWSGGTVFRNDIILQDIASNDMLKKWHPDGDQAWMDRIGNFTFTSEDQAFNGIWVYDYEGISRANLAINSLTNPKTVQGTGINDTLKNRLLGEVYFLRAFYYFDLVNNFGGVPLILTPPQSFAEAFKDVVRAPVDKVWAQINSDLSNAKTLLPKVKYPDPLAKWRVSIGAVISLQAKVALYNKQWTKVISLISELDGYGFYSLNSNYFDSFDANKKFADHEVIFAYDHTVNQIPNNDNGLSHVSGWGFFAPTTNFLKAFEPHDPRLLYAIDTIRKFSPKIIGSTTTLIGYGDKVYIRYADVLLWKAEALNELGDYSGAIAIINQIRTRARNTPTENGSVVPAGTLPDRESSTNKAQIMGWIMHERRVELGFEGQRFNDLKRWRTAKTFLAALGINFQDRNYLYPIPQGEVDKSGGVLLQNPGY